MTAQTPFAPERFDAMQLLAQVLVAQGHPADALPIPTTLVSQCRSNGQINQLLPALVWQARVFVSQGPRQRRRCKAMLGRSEIKL